MECDDTRFLNHDLRTIVNLGTILHYHQLVSTTQGSLWWYQKLRGSTGKDTMMKKHDHDGDSTSICLRCDNHLTAVWNIMFHGVPLFCFVLMQYFQGTRLDQNAEESGRGEEQSLFEGNP